MSRESFGLPPKFFMYTVDQIATMLGVSEATVKTQYLHYEGREIIPRPHNKMLARNIREPGERPEWRVAENEILRWLRYKGFKIYTRSSVTN